MSGKLREVEKSGPHLVRYGLSMSHVTASLAFQARCVCKITLRSCTDKTLIPDHKDTPYEISNTHVSAGGV